MSKSGGVFQIDDVTRTMSKGGGGAPGVPPIQVQTPPHLAGWLRACCHYGRVEVTRRGRGENTKNMSLPCSTGGDDRADLARGGNVLIPRLPDHTDTFLLNIARGRK